jgi:4-amino-4-deoxy-L-arabinose transferase-like glycosyltransferase
VIPGRFRAVDDSAAWVVLVGLLVVAFAIRLDGITSPPFDNAVARQFRSAVLARAYYVSGSTALSDQERRVVDRWGEEVEPIEPPVMELLAAGAYHVGGQERLWIPRGLSALWWVVGGFFVYLIARYLARPPGALAAAAVFLLLPFGVIASRGFQPDPLLVFAMLGTVLAVLRYDERTTGRRLTVAAAALAGAFLVKPGVALPLLAPLLLWISLPRLRAGGARARREVIAFALSLLPMLAWYAYGTLGASYLSGHLAEKVSPELLVQSSYWRGWWDQVVFALTYPVKSGPLTLIVLAVSAVGVFVAKGRARVLLLTLWSGYVVYGLVFTAHISTHNYYSLPIAFLVALSLGSIVDALQRSFDVPDRRVVAALGIAALLVAAGVSSRLHHALTDPAFGREADRYKAAGAAAGNTAGALYVDTHYGEPLRYYGWTAGALLSSGYEERPDALATRELRNALGETPPPSCVILMRASLAQPLVTFADDLERRFPVRERSAEYVVYDLPGSDGC